MPTRLTVDVETDEEILALFDGSEVIANTLEKDTTEDRDEALLDLYRKLRPGELTTVESARGLIMGAFFTPDGVQVASVAQEGLIRTMRR